MQPLPGSRFGLAMGQRLDIELEVPADGGAFPILALREGAKERTGLILATPVGRGDEGRRHVDAIILPSRPISRRKRASAVTPLPERPFDRTDA